ncbi:MAG: metalloregulator ArsR/SmtB family transcription factor [Candidatus Woesearchaeota archaeon]
MFCKSYNDFFQTLANPTNQSIIQELLKKSLSVMQIVERTGLEQSLVSHSLKKMYECKIVTFKRNGKQKIYSLNKETIIPILKIVDSHAKELCPRCLKVK